VTRDVGRIYFDTISVPPKFPIFDSAYSVETAKPYRRGKGIAVRLLPETTFVVGFWGPPREHLTEDDALFEALQGTELLTETEEIQGWASSYDAPSAKTESLPPRKRPVERLWSIAVNFTNGLTRRSTQ